jgi:hypothetical protein
MNDLIPTCFKNKIQCQQTNIEEVFIIVAIYVDNGIIVSNNVKLACMSEKKI